MHAVSNQESESGTSTHSAKSPQSESTKLIVVRHGQSRGNVEGRFGGHGPTPLTEIGHRQAAAAGEHLAAASMPARLLSSDLPRAMQTARAIAKATGLDIEQHRGLRERSVGEWDDLLFTEVQERFPEAWERMTKRDFSYVPPGGESIDSVFERVGNAIDEIVAGNRGKRVVLVSHGIAIFHMFSHICAIGSPAKDPQVFTLVDNASISRFTSYPGDNGSEAGKARGRWRIHSLNETAHLDNVSTA